MKRLWQAVLEAMDGGFGASDIFLDVTETCSPYGEATVKNAFSPFAPLEGNIGVNPYYSYESIFTHIIKPGRIPELTRYLCDMILHHLWEIDSCSGMDLEEFYVRFLVEDIGDGAFGIILPKNDFTAAELRTIAYYYFRLCRTGCYERCFCDALRILYRKAWVSLLENGDMVVFAGASETERDVRRVKAICDIFLQAGRRRHLYWDVPPGIIECSATPLGSFLLY